jgi:two-component SAPR family response regulator
MSDVCATALEFGIEPEYVRTNIIERRIPHPKGGLTLEKWPWALRIYTLSRFSVVRDGKELHFESKTQRRPLELLKALIAFGGRSVTEEQLTEALWPEAEGDAGHQTFATTLHRLRKLLSVEDAVNLEDKRLTLNTQYVWVDAWAFERTVAQADSDSSRIECALSLYGGSFLNGETAPWVVAPRERLRSKFLRAVVTFGQARETQGEHGSALSWYQRALEADPLPEELYGRLMRCYAHLGRHVEALAVYERCRANCTQVLGIEPSAEIQRLFVEVRNTMLRDSSYKGKNFEKSG